MSQALPIIDLSQYAVGQGDVIRLDQVITKFPSDTNKSTLDAHLRMYNDSGSTLQVWTDTGDTNEYVPAGGWITIVLDQAADQVHFTVMAELPNPPIQLLMCTYYKQGEIVPDIPQLGNSPIGGGISTTTNTTQALSNEGNPAPALVIDIGDNNFVNLIAIYNDGHTLWAVDQSGTKHQIFTINNVGTPLQLGQAGDISEVLGALKVDQGITDVGNFSNTGGTFSVVGTGNGTVHLGAAAAGDVLDTLGTTTYFKAPSQVVVQIPSGTTIATFSTTQLQMNNLPVTCSRINVAQSGFDHLNDFTGGGSGTFGTGLGVAPGGIFTNCCTVSGSSQTWGCTIATSSVVTAGAGIAWYAKAQH